MLPQYYMHHHEHIIIIIGIKSLFNSVIYLFQNQYDVSNLSHRGKLKRAVGQFTPHSWTQFKWGYMESFQQFFYVVLMSIFVSLFIVTPKPGSQFDARGIEGDERCDKTS